MTRDDPDPLETSSDGMSTGIGPGIVLSIILAAVIFGVLLLSLRG